MAAFAALDPAVPVIRYEREKAGELIHINSKKLGRIDGVGHRITGNRTGQSNKRGTGWEALHVAIDDASRLAYTEILPDEKKTSATAFLERALVFFGRHGVTVERVMTDNGSAYKSHLFRDTLTAAEAFATSAPGHIPRVQTARPSASSRLRCVNGSTPSLSKAASQRTAAMAPWLCNYNTVRPHSALGGKPPIAKLIKDNVLGNDG